METGTLPASHTGDTVFPHFLDHGRTPSTRVSVFGLPVGQSVVCGGRRQPEERALASLPSPPEAV